MSMDARIACLARAVLTLHATKTAPTGTHESSCNWNAPQIYMSMRLRPPISHLADVHELLGAHIVRVDDERLVERLQVAVQASPVLGGRVQSGTGEHACRACVIIPCRERIAGTASHSTNHKPLKAGARDSRPSSSGGHAPRPPFFCSQEGGKERHRRVRRPLCRQDACPQAACSRLKPVSSGVLLAGLLQSVASSASASPAAAAKHPPFSWEAQPPTKLALVLCKDQTGSSPAGNFNLAVELEKGRGMRVGLRLVAGACGLRQAVYCQIGCHTDPNMIDGAAGGLLSSTQKACMHWVHGWTVLVRPQPLLWNHTSSLFHPPCVRRAAVACTRLSATCTLACDRCGP